MAISRVQMTGSVPPSGTIGSAIFVSQPTAGNLIVAAFTTFGGTIASVGDSAGNTYTRRAWGSSTGPQYVAIYSAENITTGANFTVFGTESGAHGVTTVIAEYAGAVAVGPFDSAGSATATGATANTGTTAALAQPAEMAFGVFTHNGGSITINETLTGGWTAGTKFLDGNSYQPLDAFDNILTANTAIFETGTLGASQTFIGVIATFKAGVGTVLRQSTGTAALGLGAGTVTFPSNITSGNLVVVGVTVTNAAVLGTVGTITDTVGNTYKKAVGGTISEVTSVIDEEIWYAPITTGGTGVLTVTHTTDNAAIYAREYSGGYNAVDVVGSATGSSTAPNTGTATTTKTDLLIISTGDDKGVTQTYKAASVYGDMVGTTTTLTGLSMEDSKATAGAQTGTLTLGGAANWVSCFASFYGSVAASTYSTFKTLTGVGNI
jgi:hypothetical protein